MHGEGPGGRWQDAVRRAVDVVAAVAGLVVTAPLWAVIVLAIRCDSPGPALFRQPRVGARQKVFTFYKFRTMHMAGDDRALRELIAAELRGEDTSSRGSWKLDADARVTRVGRILRRTSLDELPQLINVLRGEMTLVGPRPCLVWEAQMFPREYAARFAVKPGLTGLWQVNGRSRVGTLEMLRMDVCYVGERSLRRDLDILLRTLPALVRGDGAR